MIYAPNLADLAEAGLVHGFGQRDSIYPEGVRTAKQIHSGIVQDAAGDLGEGDALVSKQPGVLAGVRTADCVPILIADPSTRQVAAIHAGWRGTALGISPLTLRNMVDRWHTDLRNLRAAIGPAIGVCCYEVGPEVARRFGVETNGPVRLDLPGINEMQLRNAGISNIWKSPDCTFCIPASYYSYRREREKAGRMLSFIGWR